MRHRIERRNPIRVLSASFLSMFARGYSCRRSIFLGVGKSPSFLASLRFKHLDLPPARDPFAARSTVLFVSFMTCYPNPKAWLRCGSYGSFWLICFRCSGVFSRPKMPNFGFPHQMSRLSPL